jgi:hypothetical protein
MKFIPFFLLTFLFFACGQNGGPSPDLTLIPRDQIVDRAKSGNFDYVNATFKTQRGGKLNAKEQKMLNDGNLGKDYYEDANGVIKEVLVRPIEMEDKFIEIQRRELAGDPLKGIQIIDVDCNNLDSIFKEVYRTDQFVRQNGGDIQGTDTRNLQFVVSSISKCGWSEKNTQTIWLILQHAPMGVAAYYYPESKALAEKGYLSKTSFAMLQDLMLMAHGYKQLYGTQIVSGELYKLVDPDKVNERRKEVGMGPIEDFLGIWGLDFDTEKKRMKKEEG